MAKSLLLQKKFDLAEEYYLKLTQDFPGSIWEEKANLEYADLFYLKEDFSKAEEAYHKFSQKFQKSEYIPYCLYQLAICQEKNEKYQDSYNNYKKIYLDYPYNEYSKIALENLTRLTKEKSLQAFIPSASQIYTRGEILFSRYLYTDAIEEFNKILGKDYLPNLTQELHSKTLFKLGMCYYNLRDYQKSRDYLSTCYEKFPSSSVSDDCLYFLGRVFTNLNLNNEAISSYKKLLNQFPQSKYIDDTLYRLGRIYYFLEDWQNAKNYYNRIINEYPSGDKLPEALWELGWLQYRTGEHISSINTFSKLSASFKGSQLEEKALFWQAKNYQKLGEIDKAIQTYQTIINLNSYSYYTFKSRDILAELGTSVEISKIDTQLNPENPGHKNLVPEVYKNLDSDYMNSASSTTTPTNQNSDTDANATKITHLVKAKELLNLELYTSASLEIEAGASELEENPIGILELSTLYLESKDFGNSVALIRKNYNKLRARLASPYKDYLYYLAFPYGYKDFVAMYSSQNNLDPLFVLAVIREESSFKADAVSFAGALGLMQIIPSTGKSIANQLGTKNFSQSMLLDPETNIKMGTFYLKQMLDNFDQNKYFALGAYNGGPRAMEKWVSSRGNMDIDEFIETIPYDETRNYIKKVMGSYHLYKLLYE